MESIKILSNSSYLPKNKIENNVFNEKFNLEQDWIYKRTGIQTRFYAEENIEQMAIQASIQAINKVKTEIQDIGIIVVATTSTKKLMPGISFLVQKALGIKECICMDILAGCSGYINAFDLVRKYMLLDDIDYGLVIGVEKLSEYINEQDINTAILLGDGAGATLLKKIKEQKQYTNFIQSDGANGEILTCNSDEKITMDGKQIYKYGTTKTIENIKQLLKKADTTLEEIQYIIPHQSNARMLKSMSEKLLIEEGKIYQNLEKVGNTFCASIPIALTDLMEEKKLSEGQKIILIGYGRRTKSRKYIIGNIERKE